MFVIKHSISHLRPKDKTVIVCLISIAQYIHVSTLVLLMDSLVMKPIDTHSNQNLPDNFIEIFQEKEKKIFKREMPFRKLPITQYGKYLSMNGLKGSNCR